MSCQHFLQLGGHSGIQGVCAECVLGAGPARHPQLRTTGPALPPAPAPERPSAPCRSRRPPRDCARGPERGRSPDASAAPPSFRLGSQGQTRPGGGVGTPPSGAIRGDALASGCGPLPHCAEEFVHCLLPPRESLSFWVTPPQGKGGWGRSPGERERAFPAISDRAAGHPKTLCPHVLLWVTTLEVGDDHRKAFPGHLLCYMLDPLTSSTSVRSPTTVWETRTTGRMVQMGKLRLGEIKQCCQVTEIRWQQKPWPQNPKSLGTLGGGLFHCARLPQIDLKQNFPPNSGGASPKLPDKRRKVPS